VLGCYLAQQRKITRMGPRSGSVATLGWVRGSNDGAEEALPGWFAQVRKAC